MALRLWLMLVVMVVAVASLLPGSVFADDECDYEPYSTVCVPASTLATTTTTTDGGGGTTQGTTADPAATTNDSSAVLDNTSGRGGERLPNTGGSQPADCF